MTSAEQERERIASFIERYALRLVAGPAKHPHATPINRNLYADDEARQIKTVLDSVAGMVRAGFEPEQDWPDAKGSGDGNGV